MINQADRPKIYYNVTYILLAQLLIVFAEGFWSLHCIHVSPIIVKIHRLIIAIIYMDT